MVEIADLKRVVKQAMPGLSSAAGRRWRRLHEIRGDRRLRRIARELRERYGPEVRRGPFVGMKYIDTAVGSALVPKLLGSYERELQPVIEQLVSVEYPLVMDVGCAEGYYAVGMAFRSPRTAVRAFDIDPRAKALCAELARMNGVADRVCVEGECSAATLNQIDERRVLLICDCEGYESELLDPRRCPGLAGWDVLVEFHDFAVPGVTEKVRQLLEPTHVVELIDAESPMPELHPEIEYLSREDRALALSEFRYWHQQWGFFQSRAWCGKTTGG